MTSTVTLLVLVSAVCHATWNAIIRSGGDKVIGITRMLTAGAVVLIPGVLILAPPNREAWPWLIASMVIHTGYNLGLALAYSHADLSRTYPLVRGTAPLLTLLVAPLFLSDQLAAASVVGIVVLAAGIVTLAFERGIAGLLASPRGLIYSLATSLCITAYTISDGSGARAAVDPNSYVLYLFLLEPLPLLLVASIIRPGELLSGSARDWTRALAGGMLSIGAYWIAIWAMTVVPIAIVAALRETSILFAVLIGLFVLGEKLTPIRGISVALVLCGLVLMRI